MKTNFRKLFAALLAALMLLAVLPVGALSAESNVPEPTRGMTLDQLRAKFPNGKYWNHANNPGKDNNNQNGWTDTPCPQHGNVGTSSQTCNGFQPGATQLSWQCMGFAEKLGYDATGANPRDNANGWQTVTSASALDSLKPGDIVRYKNNGHSIYVIGVNGDTVVYADCNSDGHCKIRWDATISKATLRASFSYLRVAPGSVSPGSGSQPGTDPQPSADQYPIGAVDTVEGHDGYIRISGWTFDPDCSSMSIPVHVYLNGVHVQTLETNHDRLDVRAAFGIEGFHGFEGNITTSLTGTVNVQVYAIGVDSSGNDHQGNELLYDGDVVMGSAQEAPVGLVEVMTGQDGRVYIRGWAFDPDCPSNCLILHVYIGDSFCGSMVANKSREDVNSAYGITGNHGFEGWIRTSLTGSQTVRVHALGVDENGEQDGQNPVADNGEQTVSISYTTNQYYIVRFKGKDGVGLLDSQLILRGNSAVPPEPPVIEGLTFSHWSGSYTNVTEDIELWAIYTSETVDPTLTPEPTTPPPTTPPVTPPPTTPPVTPPPETPVDPDAPQIVVESKTAVVGNTATVNISIANNPGFINMKLHMSCDPALTLVSVTDTGLIPGWESSPALSNPYILIWNNDTTASENITVNGTIATLTFSVPDGTEEGDYPVSISNSFDGEEILDFDFDPVEFAVVNGSIHVIDVLIGDVNSDGKVTTKDRGILARYLAGWADYPASIINFAAADVNVDGKVTTKDRGILARHLAGWAGYETLPYTTKGVSEQGPFKGAPTIVVGSVEGQPGETVTVPISIQDNPGFINMKLHLEFDPRLTLIAVNDTGLIPGKEHSPTLGNPYLLVWNNDTTASDNLLANGVIVNLVFQLPDGAEAGEYYVNVSYDNDQEEILDFNFDTVDFAVTNGSITVTPSFTAPEFLASMACIRSRATQDELTDVRFIFKAVFNKGYIDNNGYDFGCADSDRVQITEWGVKYSIGTLVSNVNYVCPFLADANDTEFRFNVVIAGIPEAYNSTEITMIPYMLVNGAEISGEPFTSSVESIRNN